MDEQDAQIPSRSARKREASAVEDLARDLVDMSVADIAALELGSELMTVVERARGLSKGARKREIKYLAGLLRSNETQLEQARCFQRGVSAHQLEEKRLHHTLERWRDGLCNLEQRSAIRAEIIATLPKLEVAALDKLVHRYQGPGDKKTYRQIFTLLRKGFDATGEV
ncbi:MAG: ribosome biogenesis factor YjgA [Desulfuromonadaceae bacterium]|nr:ribosome biogenesis factor YjgA [Desulfuromonadaceae bacterium]